MNTYIYDLANAISANAATITGLGECLFFTSCDVTDTNTNPIFVHSPEDKYNCNVGACDRPYQMPYIQGDQLCFQTHFADVTHSDPTNPTSHFVNVEIIDTCTDDVYPFSAVSQMFTGWSEEIGSFQNIVIDTSSISFAGCWYIRFSTPDGQEFWTQDFQAIDLNSCIANDVIELEGKGLKKDCHNNVYEAGVSGFGDNIYFCNKIRLKASLISAAGEIEIDRYAKRVIRSKRIKYYTFTILEKIPQYIQTYLEDVVFPAGLIEINGEEYEVESLSFSNQVAGGTMYSYSLVLKKECEADLDC